jgi:Ser/Thr protein kinase RdoA (MazF antagonist)
MRTVRSLLHPVDLGELVGREYEIRPPVTATLLQRGFNDAYLITDGHGARRVLRVYAKDKYWLSSEADICFEVELLDHLALTGRAVAHPYRRQSGEFLGRLDAPEGQRSYALFTFAPGKPLGSHSFDEKLWHAVGVEMARLHGAMDAFESTNSRYHLDLETLIDMPLAAIKPYVTPEEESTYAELTEIGQRMKDAISGKAWGPGTYGLIHSDAHDSNMHVTAEGTFTLFDFDHCGFGWRAYDLAPFYQHVAAPAEDRRKWTAFLAGYEEVRPLSTSERDALPVFSACRALWDVGDWLHAVHWTGDAWALDGLCKRTLKRVREPIAEHPK